MEKNRNIIYPENLERGNYEFNILLILSRNDCCEWQDFLDDRLSMSPTTVSKYTRKLKEKRFIKKTKRKYEITSEGKKRLEELESIGGDKSFPPDDIELNSDEKVIWMVNNNPYCQWRDFMNDRLEINRSNLSKTLNRLIRNDLIEKKIDSEISSYPIYVKKKEGVRKYRLMLKSKKIDPKTRHLEKIKRIKEISQYNRTFFDEYDIQDFEIKHRFNMNRLVFDFSTHKDIFRENENHYNLTLLFLSINHPDNFPNSTTSLDFCTKYNLKEIELNYYLSELLEAEITPIKIFNLKIEDKKYYYFHEKSKLAKILKAITQEYLEKKVEITLEREGRKFDYDMKIPLNYEDLQKIISIICEKHEIFNMGLRSSLLKFLPGYINYLEYKIEQKYDKLSKKRYLISREYDRIEYLKISMDLTEIPSEPPQIIEDKAYEVSDEIKYFDKETLDSIKLSQTKITNLIKNKNFNEAIIEINENLSIFNKTDLEIQFYQKLYEIDKEYYYLRLFFYNKKIYCLINLKKFEEILEVAVKIYDLDSITDIVIDLIELEENEIADEIIEKAIDPSKTLNDEYLAEARNISYFGVYAHFHNKVNDEFNNQNYENAMIFINKFLKFNPNDYEMVENQIKAFFYLDKHERALELVEDAIMRWPKAPKISPINWEIIGEKNEKELETKETPEEGIYNYKFCHLKARILLNMKRYTESLKLLEKIIKVNSNISETYFLRSLNEFELEDDEQALKSIDLAIKIDPIKDLYYGVKSDFFFKLNKYSKALELINKSIELNSRKPIYYNIKAKILFFMNKQNAALDIINQGIKNFPNFSSFYNTKSLILADEEKSLEALEKAEELGSEISYYNKAQSLYNLRQNNEALEAINIEIEKNPDEPTSHVLKAAILAELGRFDEAFKTFQSLNETNVDFASFSSIEPHLYNKMAYYFTEKGNREEAIVAIKKAIEISPEEAEYYDSYGEILMIFEDYENAVEKFEVAKKLHFTPIETYINLGKCLFELGKFEEALENFKIGKNRAAHNVKKVILSKDDKRMTVDFPQTELIEEAEKNINQIKRLTVSLTKENMDLVGKLANEFKSITGKIIKRIVIYFLDNIGTYRESLKEIIIKNDKKKSDKVSRTTVTLSNDYLNLVRELAEEFGLTKAELIRNIIEYFFKNKEKHEVLLAELRFTFF